MLVTWVQVLCLKLERFAIVHYVRKHLVKHIELVVQHRKDQKRMDIVDRVMENNLDHG